MDHASKELLRRDLFIQGLLWKWQEKVMQSVSTFADALHQARAVEEQEKQLSEMHKGHLSNVRPPPQSLRSSVPSRGDSDSTRGTHRSQSGTLDSARSPTGSRLKESGQCYRCGSYRHKARDCPQRRPPTEATSMLLCLLTTSLNGSKPIPHQTRQVRLLCGF